MICINRDPGALWNFPSGMERSTHRWDSELTGSDGKMVTGIAVIEDNGSYSRQEGDQHQAGIR